MTIKLIITNLIAAFFLSGCFVVVYKHKPSVEKPDDFIIRFTRDIFFPNTYNFKIINRTNENITFTATEKDFYAVMKNGTSMPLDLKGFRNHAVKGMIWAVPRRSAVIPFKIRKDFLQNIKHLVMIGSCQPTQSKWEMGDLNQGAFYTQMIIFTIDLENRTYSFEKAEKIFSKTPTYIFNDEFDPDQYRLLGNRRDQQPGPNIITIQNEDFRIKKE